MTFNKALADDKQWGTPNEEAVSRLQFNAFHHSGEAFEAMRQLARFEADDERKKLDRLIAATPSHQSISVPARPIISNIDWLTAAVRAAIVAQDTWSVVRSISESDEDAEQKIGVALRRMQRSVMAEDFDNDEQAWFEEICCAVERQEYAGLIPAFHMDDEEEEEENDDEDN